jgi:hypothetical protein
MPLKLTNLNIASTTLTLNAAERAALVERFPDLPRKLVEILLQSYVRRDRLNVSANDLELLDERLSAPLGRSATHETRLLLKGIHEQVADELILMNSRTSPVAIDNASHKLYLTSERNAAPPTLEDAIELLSKLRALPLRLRNFKLAPAEKRILRRLELPDETRIRVNSATPTLNLADILIILSRRFDFDRVTQSAIVEELLSLRDRILDNLAQASRRTVEINRQRSLKTQQEWRRKSSSQDDK